MTRNRTFIGWLLVAIIGLAPASSAYADPIVFSVAQHNIQAVNWGADQHDEWAIARRYLSETSMAQLDQTRDTDPAQPEIEG